MRIFSKFRDYYDGLAEHEKGDYLTCVWTRTEKDVEVYINDIKELDERSKHMFVYGHSIRPCYLIIAGKVYPFLQDRKDPEDKYLYSVEEVEKRRQGYFRKHYREQERISFFAPYPDMTDLCLRLEAPIILICPYSPNYQAGQGRPYRNVAINVKLSDWGFQKVMSAPEVYQVLDVFMSNVMVKDQMPPTQQTDIEKVEAHGFDKKTSFRNIK